MSSACVLSSTFYFCCCCKGPCECTFFPSHTSRIVPAVSSFFFFPLSLSLLCEQRPNWTLVTFTASRMTWTTQWLKWRRYLSWWCSCYCIFCLFSTSVFFMPFHCPCFIWDIPLKTWFFFYYRESLQWPLGTLSAGSVCRLRGYQVHSFLVSNMDTQTVQQLCTHLTNCHAAMLVVLLLFSPPIVRLWMLKACCVSVLHFVCMLSRRKHITSCVLEAATTVLLHQMLCTTPLCDGFLLKDFFFFCMCHFYATHASHTDKLSSNLFIVPHPQLHNTMVNGKENVAAQYVHFDQSVCVGECD